MHSSTINSQISSRLVAIIFILFALNFVIQAQNIKKMFRGLEENNIEQVKAEINEINSEKKYTYNEIVLVQVAICIFKINENDANYNPYVSLSLYSEILFEKADQSEIDKFLKKYNYSIEIVHELIYAKILKDAKLANTEKAYREALSVCTNCFYETEAKILLEESVYLEAKITKTAESYLKFLNYFPASIKSGEIYGLLEGVEFFDAKKRGTLPAINEYINDYSVDGNKYLQPAIDIRDSIAFKETDRNYNDYLEYTKRYPNSRFFVSARAELPNLLYNQAKKENSIELLGLFLKEYPKDNRCSEVKNSLENIYYQNLKDNISRVGIADFKSRFPNSSYIPQIDEIILRLSANSDLKKKGYNGAIKSIETVFTNFNSTYNTDVEYSITDTYNDLGNNNHIDNDNAFHSEELEHFMEDNNPEYILDDRDIKIDGTIKPILEYFSESVDYEYNSNGMLSRITGENDGKKVRWDFEYDNHGNIITKDILRTSSHFTNDFALVYKIKNTWLNGKLKSKYIYKGNGERYRFYDIEYSGNKQIISDVGNLPYIGGEKRIATLIINNNQVLYKLIEENVNYNGFRKVEYIYSYNNGYLGEIHVQTRMNVDTRNQPERDYLNNIGYIINRDYNGQIVSIISSSRGYCRFCDLEWTYKYDNHNNWIEKTEFSIKRNDIIIKKKEKVIKRIITYY